MREKRIEIELRNRIKNVGGMYYKFVSQSNNGIPDRICVFPSGKLVFVELKRPGKKPSKIQEYQLDKLRELKQEVRVVKSLDDVKDFMHEFKSDYLNTTIKRGDPFHVKN